MALPCDSKPQLLLQLPLLCSLLTGARSTLVSRSPPAHGKRWAWGSTQWHQVPIDQQAYDASQLAAEQQQQQQQRARARLQSGVEQIIEGMGIREERRAKSLAVSAVEAFSSSPKSP